MPFDEVSGDETGYRTASSPLILDLNGDGVKTRRKEGGTSFDHDGDGFDERTGWVDAYDGLLA